MLQQDQHISIRYTSFFADRYRRLVYFGAVELPLNYHLNSP